jgi:predicted RNA methylase
MAGKQLYGYDQDKIKRQIQAANLARAAAQDAEAQGQVGANVGAVATGLATSLAGKVRRLGIPIPGSDILSQDADTINRYNQAVQGAMAKKDEELQESTGIPSWLTRGARGVATQVPEMLIAGAAGGLPGVIADAAGGEANQAITAARDAGLPESEVMGHALRRGAIEGVVTGGFSVLGGPIAGGVESMVANAFKQGGKEALKSAATKGAIRQTLVKKAAESGKALPPELAEELTIGYLGALEDVYSGVNPSATNPDELLAMAGDTLVQTLGTMGVVGAYSGAMDAYARKVNERGEQPAEPAPTQQPAQQPVSADQTTAPEAVDEQEEAPESPMVADVLTGLFSDGKPKTVDEIELALEEAGFDIDDPDVQADANAAVDDLLTQGYVADAATGTISAPGNLTQDRNQDGMRKLLLDNGVSPDVVNGLDPDGLATMAAVIEQEIERSLGVVPQTESEDSKKGGDPDGEVMRNEGREEAPEGTVEPETTAGVSPGTEQVESPDVAPPQPSTDIDPDEYFSGQGTDEAQTEPPVVTSLAPVQPEPVSVPEIQTDGIGEETTGELPAPENIESTEPETTQQNPPDQTGEGEPVVDQKPTRIDTGEAKFHSTQWKDESDRKYTKRLVSDGWKPIKRVEGGAAIESIESYDLRVELNKQAIKDADWNAGDRVQVQHRGMAMGGTIIEKPAGTTYANVLLDNGKKFPAGGRDIRREAEALETTDELPKKGLKKKPKPAPEQTTEATPVVSDEAPVIDPVPADDPYRKGADLFANWKENHSRVRDAANKVGLTDNMSVSDETVKTVRDAWNDVGKLTELVSQRLEALGLDETGVPKSADAKPLTPDDVSIDDLMQTAMQGFGTVEDASAPAPEPAPKKGLKKKTSDRLKDKADKARKEADDLWSELESETDGLFGFNPFANPKLQMLAARLVVAEVKANSLNFAAFVANGVERMGEERMRQLAPLLESAWTSIRDRFKFEGMTEATSIVAMLDESDQGNEAFANEPQAIPAYVVSGMQKGPKDIAARKISNRPIGIAVTHIQDGKVAVSSDRVIDLVALHANRGNIVFLDSGMFGTVMRGEIGQEPEWERVFEQYDRVIERVDEAYRSNVMIVAPDYLVKTEQGVIGDPFRTQELQSQYRFRLQEYQDQGVSLIVPVQRDFTGENSLSDLAADVTDFIDFNTKRVSFGIPYNAARFSDEEILEFVTKNKGLGMRLHLLGGGKARAEKLWEKIRAIDPTIFLTGDSATEVRNRDRFPTDEPGPDPVASVPDHQLANEVKAMLDRGDDIDSKVFFEMADRVFGGTRANNVYGDSRAYDALELGVNMHFAGRTDPTAGVKAAKATIKRIQETMAKVPRHKGRTGEKDNMQQFSTPPAYAYAVNWIANVSSDDTALEPSAGIGGIAIYAKNGGARVAVNELSTERLRNLEQLPFDHFFNEDAEQIHAILRNRIPGLSVVVMNPPFSRAGKRMGNKMVQGTDRKHMEKALALLPEGGRLVAIVGAGLHEQQKGMTNWLANLPFAVRANVEVARDVYRGYGTEFPTRVLVIDKVPRAGFETVSGEAADLDQLIDLLEDVRNDRQPVRRSVLEQEQDQPSGETSPGTIEDSTEPTSPTRDGVDGLADEGATGIDSTTDNDGTVGSDAGASVSPDATATESTSGSNGKGTGRRRIGGRKGGKPGSKADGGQSTTDSRDVVGEPVDNDGTGVTPAAAASISQSDRAVSELSESTYEAYRPSIQIPGAVKHPAPLVESAAMAAVNFPIVNYQVHIPEKTIKGYTNENGVRVGVSDIQLEAIAAAGYAHSQMLPDGSRRGFLIGDGTGVGKAREATGIIMDNWNQGRQKAVWITKSDKLEKQAREEWEKVGGNPNLFKKHGNIGSGEKITDEKGIYFSTYGTIPQLASDTARSEGNGLGRVEQLVDWLGADFDGVIVFDEAHLMGNATDSGEGRNKKSASKRALAGVDLQMMLPNARIVYMSATAATEVSNLAYAQRLGLWGEGTQFPDMPNFLSEIIKGGVAAMEKVAADMKAMGMYLARNISFNDGTPKGTVEFERVTHELTPDQADGYDKMSEAWNKVFQNIGAALELTEGDGHAKGRALSQFWSANQRFWNQVITAMQVPTMISQIETDLKEGRSVLVQLTSTNEAATNRAIESKDKDADLDEIDTSPRYILMDFLERSFPTQMYEEYMDENGNTRKRPVLDSEGNPVHDPDALAMKEALLDELGALQVADRGAIDMLIDHFGEEMVSEITGRSKRIIRKSGKSEMQKRGKAATSADHDAFMDAKKRILVFSEAGGTGASYHADLTRKNQQRRAHYVLQPGWRADVAVQGLGRAHRSNQASAPIIKLMQPNLNGYKRFISTIARRLSQLGALTKGQREAGDSGVFSASDNLESTEARAGLVQFFKDAIAGNIEGVSAEYLETRLGLRVRKEDGSPLAVLPPIAQMMNRVLNLPIEEQNYVFDQIQARIDTIIEAAVANGTLDQGMETIKAESVVKKSEQVVNVHPTGAETKHVVLTVRTKTDPRSPQSIAKTEGVIGYVRSAKTGKVFAMVETNQSEQDAQGRISRKVKLLGVGGTTVNTDRNLNNETNWIQLSPKEFRDAYQAEFDSFPEFKEEEMHLLAGALLPVWGNLPEGTNSVKRALTTDGEQILGREIKASDLEKTLRKLGAVYSGPQIAVADAMDVVRDGGNLELSNGWRIKRSRVQGEETIEIVNVPPTEAKAITDAGGFSRRLDYKVRYFIPIGKEGDAVLEKLVSSGRTIVEVNYAEGQSGDGTTRQSATIPALVSATKLRLFTKRPAVSKGRTKEGGKLLEALKADAKSGSRQVGKRSIGEFLNRAFSGQLIVTNSQTSKRNPAVFVSTGATTFTRSGTWDVNIHEAGHAMDAMLTDANPDWYAEHEQEIVDFAMSDLAPHASAPTVAEGIAELVRLYVTGQQLDLPLMQSFTEMLERVSSPAMAALDDAQAAYAFHEARPYEDKRAADRNDRTIAPSVSPTVIADSFWGTMNQVVGNSVLIHRMKRKLWKSITGESALSMLDPTGVIGSVNLFLQKQSREAKKVAKAVMSSIVDTTADVSRAYQRKLGAEAVKLQAMQGSGLSIYISGKGLKGLSKADLEALQDAGFPLPDKFAGDGELQQITDKSFEQIKEAVGKDWQDFETAVFDRVALERYRKAGHAYPGMLDGRTPKVLKEESEKAFREHPEWETHFKDLERFMGQTLLVGMLGGQHTVQEVINIFTAWEDYAPLQRQVENRTSGKGSSKTDPDFGVKKAKKGSYLEFRALEDSVRDRVSKAVSAYHDNNLIKAVRDQSMAIGQDTRIAYEVRKDIQRTMIPLRMDSEIKAVVGEDMQAEIIAGAVNRIELQKLGIDTDGMSDSEVAELIYSEGGEAWTADDIQVALPGMPLRVIRGKKRPDLPRVVGLWENGERRYYYVSDPLMFSMFANSGDINQVVSGANRLLGGLTEPWKRAYTHSLKFLIRSILRDPVTAAFLSEHKSEMIPGWYIASAVFYRITGNEFSKEARTGAELMTKALDTTTHHDHQSFLRQFKSVLSEGIAIKGYYEMPMAEKLLSAPGQVMSMALKPVDVFNYITGTRWLSQQAESLGREGAYIAERKRGFTPSKAQERYEKSAGNFGQRQANKAVAGFVRTAGFLNPSLQILWQTYEAMNDPNPSRRLVLNGTRATYLAAVGASAAAINIALIHAMFGDDEEKLEEVLNNMRERDEKEKLGNAAVMGWFRMPFDYGVAGSVMSSAWNATEETLLGVKVDREKRALELAERAASLPGFDDLIPPFPKTLLEQVRNKSFYTDRDIVPDRMLSMYADNPQLQYHWDTPELYKYVGSFMGVSPLRVEHAVRGLSTSIYDDTIKYLDKQQRGLATTRDIPLWRGLTTWEAKGRYSRSVRSLDDLNREYMALDQKINEDSRISPEAKAEYADRRETLALAHGTMNAINDLMDANRKERDKDAPNYDKIKANEAKMTQLAADFINSDKVDTELLREQYDDELKKMVPYQPEGRKYFKIGYGAPSEPKKPTVSRSTAKGKIEWKKYEKSVESYPDRVKKYEEAQQRAREFVNQYNKRRLGDGGTVDVRRRVEATLRAMEAPKAPPLRFAGSKYKTEADWRKAHDEYKANRESYLAARREAVELLRSL